MSESDVSPNLDFSLVSSGEKVWFHIWSHEEKRVNARPKRIHKGSLTPGSEAKVANNSSFFNSDLSLPSIFDCGRRSRRRVLRKEDAGWSLRVRSFVCAAASA